MSEFEETPRPPRRWLTTLHAGTALVLMVLFFALATASAVGLVFLGYQTGAGVLAHVRGRGVVMGLLLALGLAGAGLVVLWSLLPRLDRFTPPGPELDEAGQPELWREVRRVAARAGERPPAHVYLLGDVNAFVTERGGFLGLFSRRVMGIGLPLLSALSVSEVRAVLAHEFGHFAGGDTSLGRWIFKTRAAIGRTIVNLGNTGQAASQVGEVAVVFAIVHAPFRWFFRFYLRFTQALSRAQELHADALAVRLEGQRALVDGLTKTERAALAYAGFLRGDLAPLVERGFLPPIGQGLQLFLSAEPIKAKLDEALGRARDEEAVDPFDSHPPLAQRLAAARALRGAQVQEDPRPAVELLREVPALEVALAQAWAGEGQPLTRIAWSEAHQPLVAAWRASAQELAPSFAGLTLAALPTTAPALKLLAVKHAGDSARSASDEAVRGWAANAVAALMFVALVDAGYTPSNLPGKPLAFTRGAEAVEPALLIGQLLEGKLAAAAWQAQLDALGVGQVELGALR